MKAYEGLSDQIFHVEIVEKSFELVGPGLSCAAAKKICLLSELR